MWSWTIVFLSNLEGVVFCYKVNNPSDLQNLLYLRLRILWIMKKYYLAMLKPTEWAHYPGLCILWCISLQPSFLSYTHHFSVIIDWIMLLRQRPISTAVLWERRLNIQLITFVLLGLEISLTLKFSISAAHRWAYWCVLPHSVVLMHCTLSFNCP